MLFLQRSCRSPCWCAAVALVSFVLMTAQTTFAFTPPIPSPPMARANYRHTPQRFLFSAFLGGDFATTEDIQSALENGDATIMDVRGSKQIASAGYWKTSQNHAWVHIPCSPFEANLLEQTAPSWLRDKAAPVIIHCVSGKRAAKAKEVSDGLGYQQVLNVGGWNEVQEASANTQ